MSAAVVSAHISNQPIDPWLHRIVNQLKSSESLEDASVRLRSELAAFAEEVVRGTNNLQLKKMSTNEFLCEQSSSTRLKRRVWDVGENVDCERPNKLRKLSSVGPSDVSNVAVESNFPSASFDKPANISQEDECQTLVHQLASDGPSVGPWISSPDSQNYNALYNNGSHQIVQEECHRHQQIGSSVASSSDTTILQQKLQQAEGNQRLLARAVRTLHAKSQLLLKALESKTDQCKCLEDDTKMLKDDLKRQKEAYNTLQYQVATILQGKMPRHDNTFAWSNYNPWDEDNSGGNDNEYSDKSGFGDQFLRGPPDVF